MKRSGQPNFWLRTCINFHLASTLIIIDVLPCYAGPRELNNRSSELESNRAAGPLDPTRVTPAIFDCNDRTNGRGYTGSISIYRTRQAPAFQAETAPLSTSRS